MKLLEKVFSIKNSFDRRHKIVNILGIKIKFKSKYYNQSIINISENVDIDSEQVYLNTLYTYRLPVEFKKTFDKLLSVTIIIPVYNGFEHLEKLIPNLISTITPPQTTSTQTGERILLR